MLVARCRDHQGAQGDGVVHGTAEHATALKAGPAVPAWPSSREPVQAHADGQDVGSQVESRVDALGEPAGMGPAAGARHLHVEQADSRRDARVLRAARGDDTGTVRPVQARHAGRLRAGGNGRRDLEEGVERIDTRIQHRDGDSTPGKISRVGQRLRRLGLARPSPSHLLAAHLSSPLDELDASARKGGSKLVDGLFRGSAMQRIGGEQRHELHPGDLCRPSPHGLQPLRDAVPIPLPAFSALGRRPFDGQQNGPASRVRVWHDSDRQALGRAQNIAGMQPAPTRVAPA